VLKGNKKPIPTAVVPVPMLLLILGEKGRARLEGDEDSSGVVCYLLWGARMKTLHCHWNQLL